MNFPNTARPDNMFIDLSLKLKFIDLPFLFNFSYLHVVASVDINSADDK